MDEQLKEVLVQQFRTYLDTDFEEESTAPPVDRMTLFSELAGLKSEVRIESRQFKGALDDFREAFTSLDRANQDLAAMVQQRKQQDQEAISAALKPVLYGLIELHDRVAAGLAQPPPTRSSFLAKLLPKGQRDRRRLAGHLEAQQMILTRILDILNQCGVSSLTTRGKQFDPNRMKAVGSASDPTRPGGTVLGEERKGFTREGGIIRPAEVIVNKREE